MGGLKHQLENFRVVGGDAFAVKPRDTILYREEFSGAVKRSRLKYKSHQVRWRQWGGKRPAGKWQAAKRSTGPRDPGPVARPIGHVDNSHWQSDRLTMAIAATVRHDPCVTLPVAGTRRGDGK
jgi:hypothetical protein